MQRYSFFAENSQTRTHLLYKREEKQEERSKVSKISAIFAIEKQAIRRHYDQRRESTYWLDIANYDLDTAEAMYQTGRWLYVAFMCHQVIEKTLKAYWCGTQPDDPPYIHNHMRLAEGSGLYERMNDDQRDFLDTITNYNIEARYPEDKEELSRILTEQFCRQIIDNTKQMQQWIKDRL